MPDPMNMNPMPAAPEKKSYGALVGIIVVILVLILAGFYFWGERVANNEAATVGAESDAMMEDGTVTSVEEDLSGDVLDEVDVDLEEGL